MLLKSTLEPGSKACFHLCTFCISSLIQKSYDENASTPLFSILIYDTCMPRERVYGLSPEFTVHGHVEVLLAERIQSLMFVNVGRTVLSQCTEKKSRKEFEPYAHPRKQRPPCDLLTWRA